MKRSARNNGFKPIGKAIGLLSRLGEMVVIGLNIRKQEKKGEGMEINKTVSPHNTKDQYDGAKSNYQSGKSGSTHASIDLWHYLSSDA